MKRTIVTLFVIICLFSPVGVAAKGMCCRDGAALKTTACADKRKDTCKMGVEMSRCCKAKKHLKANDQRYSSVAMAFLARLFPVLSHYVSTDTTADEPCMYHLHA